MSGRNIKSERIKSKNPSEQNARMETRPSPSQPSTPRQPLNSRIYTPARMRRRAKRKEMKENEMNYIYPREERGLPEMKKSEESEIDIQVEKKILKASDTNERISSKPHSSHQHISDSKNLPHSKSSKTYKKKDPSFEVSSKNLTSSSLVSIEHPQIQLNKGNKRDSSSRNSQKIKILATLLPDDILIDPTNRNYRPYNTALIFPDVSGFTQLCEKYDKTGKGGPSRLTEVLNGYLGSMIQIVLSRNGDVFKFGGDAFLCVWKVPVDMDIKEIIYLAIESAVDIQKNCGEHKTDVGVKLGVKIAVAAGKALFSIIGSESRKHYVIVGPPVLDVREAEMLCRSGDVIVAPSAWKYVENYMLYSYTYHSNNSHIKVHDFGPLWKPTNLNNVDNDNDSKSIRPALKLTSRLKTEDLRPFILTPVMKSIDLNQSLDYLTEMRQVAIVFFNIAVDWESMALEDVIDLSHKAFQIVSSVVDKNDGAVNKLTLFDKDMAILVVFGLKGFKHELASQVALKCAYNCVEQLKKLPTLSVSAGVTTGMAYCGVIGHVLRREYTVMGRPVNMAARLMCAYLNVVSSDRDTFLHSKLESCHFELLEQKFLKGIQHPGPFYKFNLNVKKSKLKLSYSAYPLLGRAKEIHEFEKFLENLASGKHQYNFMVIYGEARIGKTRLVAELVNMAEKRTFSQGESSTRMRNRDKIHLDINLISLTEDDSKSAHSASRLLFEQPLGLTESSSVEEKEDKIISKMGEIKDLFLLAALNPIFNVNFDLMPPYLNLSQAEQTEAQKSLIRQLYVKCFPKGTKWLIVIEDAELIDEESWILLQWCATESHNVLYLLTIGQRRVLSPTAKKVLESFKQKKLVLGEIEKWYFSGLACQILGVRGIPVELENLIQNCKNSGNPGWLESFLLTLLQSGSIYIDHVYLQNIKNLRLVTAPEEMLSSDVTAEDEKYDSSYWLDCVENFEQKFDSSHKKITVCLLGPNFFDNNKHETNLTMDTMFIKTIDALKPLEQLVLKAGSVLGNNFRRNALKFLISKDVTVDERQLAKAIRNLFEIKILTCAKGDLAQTNMMVPRRMILVSSIRKEITCECIGIDIDSNCQDLPQYASCSYMQFRSPIYRDTVYSLLLDDQKKKYHKSSIEFLRKNTTKCKSCQNVPFPNVIGYDEDNQMVLVCNICPMHGVRSTQLDPNDKFPIISRRRNWLLTLCRDPVLGSTKSLQNLEIDFGKISPNEGGDCQCSEILSSVYSVLLEHAAGCGRKDIMLEIQLEYASLSLTSYNIPLTMQILEEALALVNQMKEDKEYPEFCTPYVFSKIYTLMGATKLSMGRPDNSLEMLETSLNYMKKSLPQNSAKIKLLIKKENFKRKVMTEYLSEKCIGNTSVKHASFCDLLSECLGLVTLVHMYMEDWLMAKYASCLALNEALKSNRNFFGLCTAYTNMIEVAYHYKDVQTCSKMELCAIDICKRCTKTIIEVYELEAICRLYSVIFQTRHLRAEIENAVFIGFQSIKIASIIRSSSLRLELMPDLIFALIELNRLSEAASLLQELEFTSQLDSDKSSRIWYYALSLDFQLDTGFTVIPYETCELFVKEEEENFAIVRDPLCKHRLYTSLWLWCIRHDEWELSKSYAKTLKSFNIIEVRETPSTVFTRLKRLEGYLITLVHKMDTKNIYAITSTYNEIHSLMNRIEKDIQVVKLLKPRYIVLKAYYRQIKYRDDSCFRLLNQALSMAEKMEDQNTYDWIVHLQMVWSNAISPIQRDYWIEHCRYNLIDWHESDGITKKQSVMYSLPLPKF